MERAVSALVEPAELKALSRRSDVVGTLWLAAHLALVAAAMVAVLDLRVAGPVWASVPAMAVLGVAWVALFAPLHETTHRTPFRSLWLNRAVGWLTGLVLVLPPEGFRLFHLTHHRHTQDPLRDPEIIGTGPMTRAGYLFRLTGVPYWVAQLRQVLRHARGRVFEPWVPPASRTQLMLEARAFLAVYVGVAAVALVARSTLPLWLYVVPVLLGQPVLRAVLLAEHGGLPRVADRLLNTRTTTAGRLVSALFWNANYHAEHHLAPGVPFHALPALHARIVGQLGATAAGYAQAHADIRAGFARTETGRTQRTPIPAVRPPSIR